ncbi:hypothetical protein LG331_09845 [Vreelandella aquamarina]|uniref:hypothetical protein n=1 Tax=Vreelandella aquamarina TaxID=77097 RepID=UPI00384C3B6B
MVEIIAGVFALLIGALGVLLKQRNSARKQADDNALAARQERARREQEQRIAANREKTREESQHVQRENDQHQSAGTRPAVFGDPRLRQHSSGPDAD